MKQILLSKGKFALVDDADFDWLNQWKWTANKPTNNNNYYAVRRTVKSDMCPKKQIKMHRLILGLTDPKIKGDHIDHNGLNNQRNNLRVATALQNGQGKSSHINSSSKYLGVTLRTRVDTIQRYKYWKAQLRMGGKEICSKQFPYTAEGEILAAKAYDEMAKKYFGEFANLNFKVESI